MTATPQLIQSTRPSLQERMFPTLTPAQIARIAPHGRVLADTHQSEQSGRFLSHRCFRGSNGEQHLALGR
jgi:hypothetical protein